MTKIPIPPESFQIVFFLLSFPWSSAFNRCEEEFAVDRCSLSALHSTRLEQTKMQSVKSSPFSGRAQQPQDLDLHEHLSVESTACRQMSMVSMLPKDPKGKSWSLEGDLPWILWMFLVLLLFYKLLFDPIWSSWGGLAFVAWERIVTDTTQEQHKRSEKKRDLGIKDVTIRLLPTLFTGYVGYVRDNGHIWIHMVTLCFGKRCFQYFQSQAKGTSVLMSCSHQSHQSH